MNPIPYIEWKEKVVGRLYTWNFFVVEARVIGHRSALWIVMWLDLHDVYEVFDFGMLCLTQVHILNQRSTCSFLIRSLLHIIESSRPLQCIIMGQSPLLLSGLQLLYIWIIFNFELKIWLTKEFVLQQLWANSTSPIVIWDIFLVAHRFLIWDIFLSRVIYRLVIVQLLVVY